MPRNCSNCKYKEPEIAVPFTETGIPVVGTCARVPGDWQVTAQYSCSAHVYERIDLPDMGVM